MPTLDLLSFIPDANRRDDADGTGDLGRLVGEVFQPVLGLLQADADRWAAQIDPDLADSNTLDAMALDLGNPFDELSRSLPIGRRRLLVENLVNLYRRNGTAPGLIDIIRVLTSVEVTAIISPAVLTLWELGIEVLGGSDADPPVPDLAATDYAYLAPGNAFMAYSFQIEVGIDPTEDQELTIGKIARKVKPAHTHYLGILEPGDIVVAPDHWELGFSELDTEALLH